MDQPKSVSPRFDILAELGRGSTGIVFKARDRDRDRLVALKIPLKSGATDETRRLYAFRREVELLAFLANNADSVFPVIYDVGEHNGQLYYSRKFIDGNTLEQLVATGAFGLRDGISVLASVAGAIHHAHCQGIVHRSLHPSNILVDVGGNTKLIGFGLAGFLAGSNWLTPEKPGVSADVDLRALHQILDWLVTAVHQTLPRSLQATRQSGSINSPAAFEVALRRFLQEPLAAVPWWRFWQSANK